LKDLLLARHASQVFPRDEKTMLKSLFGELTPLRESSSRRDVEKNEFASTAIMETVIGDSAENPPVIDRHLRDLFVTGSAAQAMRTHFANSREDQAGGQRVITLFDPTQMWAGAVIKALSDASGQPIEKLQLRDKTSLSTLALIERTTLPRRQDENLKVYHADVRTQGSDASGIPAALMERSDLAAVIIGPLQPAVIDEMLVALLKATTSEHWRCTDLLFMLPVGAAWISQKIEATAWPAHLHIDIIAEPLISASTVWNMLLAHWNRIKPHPGAADTLLGNTDNRSQGGVTHGAFTNTTPGVLAPVRLPAQIGQLAPAQGMSAAPAASLDSGSPVLESARRPPDPERATVILHELMLLDGLIFAALVDANTGLVVTSEGRGPDIDRAAAAATEVIRVHRRTLRQMGHWRPNEPVDEILVTAGSRYHILRTLQAHPDFFILAVLDKLRSNLAMTRFRIMEAQQVLV
jgi:predicted regulator of Ras-like GTPase activity (Roadblock/LC7/MglB family)